MNPILLSVVLAGALCAACPTALADPPKKHNATSTVDGTRISPPAAGPATTIQRDEIADTEDQSVKANARSGSDSMHPKASITTDISDSNVAEPLRATGD